MKIARIIGRFIGLALTVILFVAFIVFMFTVVPCWIMDLF